MLPNGAPLATSGQVVGLFGGSFNPPHAGHRSISIEAIKRLRLDWLWWLVAPQNPLKRADETAALEMRLDRARAVARHPRITVTGFEATLGTRYTADTMAIMVRRWPEVRFVWVMGADSFADLHRWRHWRRLAGLVPLAVFDRPGFTLRAMSCPAAIALAGARIDASDAAGLARLDPPAWCFIEVPRRFESSTALRNGSS
jgi:nicotinate-nucleotide adenylyltransferase